MNEINEKCIVCGELATAGELCDSCNYALEIHPLQRPEPDLTDPYEDDEWDDGLEWDDEDEFESQLELDEKFDLDPVLKQHVYELNLPMLIILSKMTDELIIEKIKRLLIPSDQDLGEIPF